MNGTLLDNVPLFADLTPAQRALVRERMVAETRRSGDMLFAAGDPAKTIFLLQNGWVRLLGERNRVMANVSQGSLLGDADVLLDERYSTGAQATSNVELLTLGLDDLVELTAVDPSIGLALSKAVGGTVVPLLRYLVEQRLRRLPGLGDLPEDTLNALAARLCIHTPQAGEMLFKAGQPPTALYIVEQGLVKMATGGGQTGEYGPGELVADPSMFAERAHAATAGAVEPSWLWELSAGDLQKLCVMYPDLRTALSSVETAAEHFAERYLGHLSLFAGLSAEQIREVAGHLRPKHYRPGEAIYRQGTPGTALYLVEQGQVTVQTRTGSGIQVLSSIGPGEFFGETALLTGDPHAADAFAAGNVDSWALTREDFEALLERYPSIAINLSRTLSRRLRDRNQQPTAAAVNAAPVPMAVYEPAPRPAAAPQAPQPALTGEATGFGRAISAAISWFAAQSTGAKLRLIAVVLLVIWLLGVAAPSLVISLLSSNNSQSARSSVQARLLNPAALIAYAADAPVDAPTYTPWPTETPIPAPTETPMPTPTNTPVPTETPMPTAVPPTATAVPPTATRVPPTAAPVLRAPVAEAQVVAAAPAAAAAAPAAPAPAPKKSGKQYELIEWRHMGPCENGWKHNAFVKVIDAGGNPLDGVLLALKSADLSGDVLDVKVSGSKGAGLAEFDLYHDGAYAVFVTEDRVNLANSDVTPFTSTVRDPDRNLWPEEQCDGSYGNTNSHNSFSIIFRKNF